MQVHKLDNLTFMVSHVALFSKAFGWCGRAGHRRERQRILHWGLTGLDSAQEARWLHGLLLKAFFSAEGLMGGLAVADLLPSGEGSNTSNNHECTTQRVQCLELCEQP